MNEIDLLPLTDNARLKGKSSRVIWREPFQLSGSMCSPGPSRRWNNRFRHDGLEDEFSPIPPPNQ